MGFDSSHSKSKDVCFVLLERPELKQMRCLVFSCYLHRHISFKRENISLSELIHKGHFSLRLATKSLFDAEGSRLQHTSVGDV